MTRPAGSFSLKAASHGLGAGTAYLSHEGHIVENDVVRELTEPAYGSAVLFHTVVDNAPLET